MLHLIVTAVSIVTTIKLFENTYGGGGGAIKILKILGVLILPSTGPRTEPMVSIRSCVQEGVWG